MGITDVDNEELFKAINALHEAIDSDKENASLCLWYKCGNKELGEFYRDRAERLKELCDRLGSECNPNKKNKD